MPEIKNIEYLNAFDKFYNTTTTRFANNILAYCDNNKIKIGSILDLSCKTGTFLNVFQISKAKTFGSDISKDMISYAIGKHPKTTFKQTKSVGEFIYKNSFDIISCGFDYINTFPNMLTMSKLFKIIYKHLSNKGLFIISMIAPKTLKNNSLNFTSSNYVDYLQEVVNISSTEANLKSTFYNNVDGYVLKSTNQSALYIYSPDDIVDEIKKSGFKNCSIVNSELFDNDRQ